MTEDNHAAILREALRLGFMTCVFGGGDKPHVKVAFANLSEAHAFQDALTALASAQPRPEADLRPGLERALEVINAEWHDGRRFAVKLIRAELDRTEDLARAPAPSSQGNT